MERIGCEWCRGESPAASTTCLICGAPLNVRKTVGRSGWREAPRLREMTLFQYSNSTCQVEGALVPVVELGLAPGDGVYFEHRVLMWKDAATPLGALPNAVGSKRT